MSATPSVRSDASRSSTSRPCGVSAQWLMGKSKNHLGYGWTGRVNRKVQVTAVSGDVPDWFIGLRTFEGPLNCKAVPVRRCPEVRFRPDGNMVVSRKTYHQGQFLDFSEVHRSYDHRGNKLDVPIRITLPGSCPPAEVLRYPEMRTPPWMTAKVREARVS